ncbi:MAG: hypothetical protein JSV84_17560 [Gemmatimonadota bacterium]|nr:MAG: hypothetical protein JSV84_17560 [Gemmatimonadota bacterium]
MTEPKLSQEDWWVLKEKGVAFRSMNEELFGKFLNAIYSIKSETGSNPTDTDVLMIYLAHAEPPIQV